LKRIAEYEVILAYVAEARIVLFFFEFISAILCSCFCCCWKYRVIVLRLSL